MLECSYQIIIYALAKFDQIYAYIIATAPIQFLPIVADGDNEGMLFNTDGDRDVTSSLGGHNTERLPLACTACPS